MAEGFRRAGSGRRFRAAYAAVLARWPLPARELDVVTSQGTTRVRRCEVEGPPLVLLHGTAVTSLSWFATVAGLGARHSRYVVDSLGEIGMSVATGPLPDARANVDWLCQLLDELGLVDAHFAGTSRGGWLALTLASQAPRRVRTATVIDPPGLVRFGPRWYAWLACFGVRTMLTGSFGGPELGPFFGVLFRVLPFFRMRVREPDVLTDEQLGRITAPVHTMLDGRSALGPVRRRADRLARIPHGTVEVLPAATHDSLIRETRAITERILRTCAHGTDS